MVMSCFVVQLKCLMFILCCLIVAGRQLLRPGMWGSKSSRSKDNNNRTVSKAEINGKKPRFLAYFVPGIGKLD